MQESNMMAHGIMFHHFHNEKHGCQQGSISADQLDEIIGYYKGRIISANEWLEKNREGALDIDNICLTFDDTLLCQYEVALPVLKKHHLTAFWFVYSSVLAGEVIMLEYIENSGQNVSKA